MVKKKVFVDMTPTCREKITGWERFALTLEQIIIDNPEENLDISFPRFKNNTSGRIEYIAKQLLWHYKGAKEGLTEGDIFHSGMLPPPEGDFKKSWTIHDDIILGGHSEYARSGSIIWNTLAKQSLSKTDAFITSTKFVADELVKLGVPSKKIEIIMPPIKPLLGEAKEMKEFKGSSGLEENLSGNYAIIVGSIEKRKNPIFAAKLALSCGLTPVLAGGFSNLQCSDFPAGTLFAGRCSDQELIWLYQNALVLISASFYEGVNLPIFEALSLGTKVVASDIGVHKELTNGMVKLFPFDLAQAKKVLLETLACEFQGKIELSTPEEISKRYYQIWEAL